MEWNFLSEINRPVDTIIRATRVCFFKRFRSFNTVSVSTASQRTLKLLGVKVGGLKKKSAPLAIPADLFAHSARVRTWARSNHFQSLTAGNFEAL